MDNWYDNIDSLDGVTESDLVKMGLPQRLCKSILTTYSKIKYPTTVDQPKCNQPDEIKMMVPESNPSGLGNVGIVQQGHDMQNIPNPFSNQPIANVNQSNVNMNMNVQHQIDPRIADIKQFIN